MKINDIEYKFKPCFSAFMMYEQVSEKKYTEIETLQDTVIMYYCTLVCSNKDTYNETLDDFIELIDNDATLFSQFTEEYTKFFKSSEKKK